MRAFIAKELEALFETTKTTEGMLQDWVEQKGASVAAWLIWQHRERISRLGFVEFRIRHGAVTPAWFRVGFEKLRQRDKRWRCTVKHTAIERIYTVHWLQWGVWGDPWDRNN